MPRNSWALGTLALALVAAVDARAYNLMDQKWTSSTVAMHLQLGPIAGGSALSDGATSWGESAEAALSDWNSQLTNVQFSVVRDSTAAITQSNRVNNVFFSPTVYGAAWDPRAIAITLSRYSLSTNNFIESDVLFNSNRRWDSYRGPIKWLPGGEAIHDLRRVALHEFGHVLGLDHPDDLGQSVTAQMNSRISDLDRLATDDANGARAIYDYSAPPTITAQPASQSLSAGNSATLSVESKGVGLAFQWYKDGAAVTGATAPQLTLANVGPSAAGTYSVVVSNPAGSVSSSGATVTVNYARLVNVSVRSAAGTGSQTLIIGFVINGAGAKSVLMRGVGPSLADFGVANPLADPQLRLYNSAGVTLGQNEDWGGVGTLSRSFTSVGAFALADVSRDAAFTTVLPPGAFTAHVTSASGTGVALAEAYDLEPNSDAHLANMSARSIAGSGSDTLIVGFVVYGNVSKTVIIRGIGPTLASLGVAGPLADPRIDLYNSAGTLIAQNDNWGGGASLATAFTSVGAFSLPASSLDAALQVTLPPGAYTAHLRGATPTPGVALVELYTAP